MKWIFIIVSGLVLTGFLLLSTLTTLEALSVSLFIYCLLKFLDDLGNKISILDIPILLAFLTWLVMPVIFYHFYTRQNYLAYIWRFYMPVESDEYFSFVLPATIAMWIGLKIRFKTNAFDLQAKKYLDNLKQSLTGRSRIGFILIIVGIISGFAFIVAPAGLKQVFYFSKQLSYVGMFYVYFSDSSKKRLILLSVFLIVMFQSLASGMFGELVFLLLLSFILITLSIKIRFVLKLSVCITGMFFLLVLQSLKTEYRQLTWGKGGGSPALFAKLAADNITDPLSMFQTKKMFRVAARLNQGWLIAKTMYFVPRKTPFANGETIGVTILSIIVPRILWADKREVGGAYNLSRFWGFKLSGYSMDIGSIGEGYANFGVTGGIIFMFFYGLLFNVVLRTLLKKTQTNPTILCWLPFLFINSVQVETDILNTINSLLKGLVFMWLIYGIFKTFFRIKL